MKLPRHTIWWVLVAIVVGAIVVARLRSAIFPPELVGVWKVERTQINGLWHGRDHELGGNRELWVIRSGQLTIVRGDGPEELKLKVDSSQIPGHFDTGQPPPVRGIYQLLGDDLRVCQSLPIIPRPTDFQNELGVFQNVTVLHRVSTDATPPADGNWRPLMARIFGPEKPAPSQKTFDAEAEAYVQRVMLQIGEEGPWTESQRVVWNVAELISEVENGGFHQFLYNSSGDNAAETATQLRLIGAPKTAAMVDTACGLFPRTGPAKELELRRTQLARLSDKQIAVLDDLDAQFYARDEDLCLLLKAYWQKSSPNGPPPAANAPLDLNKPNWPNGAANESLLKRYAGTAIMLTLAAIVAVAIWRSSRPKWSLVAVIDREGVKLHQGIAQAHQRYVIDFLRNEVPVETPVTIRALREPDGQLRTEFAGGIDAGTRQRIRNFLLTMM